MNIKITQKCSMPDLSAHNDPITVGMAVAELMNFGISAEQIRFNIVNKHPSLGEIVSQDPAAGVSLSLVDEVSLDINSWSGQNGRRFSFFEAEELLQEEKKFDEWQLEDWAEYKNFIVHAFARMDNIDELSHDNLLEQYILSRLIPVQLVGFRCLNKMNVPIGKADLLEPAQWKMLCSDLRKSAVAPINPIGFAFIIAKYLRLDTDKVSYKFVNKKWVLTIKKDDKSASDILRVKWLDHLFRPIDMQVEYKWKRHYNIPRPDFLSPLKNLLAWLAQKKKLFLALFMSVLILIGAWVLYRIITEDEGQILKIEFDFGNHDIKPEFHYVVKEIGDFMKSNRDKRVVIEGHTDGIGPRDLNIILSKKRAESVKNYLIKEFEISPSRITAIGFGPDRPLVKGNTREIHRMNRRVVVRFD